MTDHRRSSSRAPTIDSTGIGTMRGGDGVYTNFVAFAKNLSRAVSNSGVLAREAFTGKPVTGTMTMLQRFAPDPQVHTRPSGLDEHTMLLTDEMPDLFPRPPSTDQTARLAHDKWIAYSRLVQRHTAVGRSIWAVIYKCCDDDLRSLIDSKKMDENDGRALFLWLENHALGKAGSVRRRNACRLFHNTRYDGRLDMHAYIAQLRKHRDTVNAHGHPRAVSALLAECEGAISHLDNIILLPETAALRERASTAAAGVRRATADDTTHTPASRQRAHSDPSPSPGNSTTSSASVTSPARFSWERGTRPQPPSGRARQPDERQPDERQPDDRRPEPMSPISILLLLDTLAYTRDFISTVSNTLDKNHTYLTDEDMADHFIDDIYAEGTYLRIIQNLESALPAGQALTFGEATDAVLRVHVSDRARAATTGHEANYGAAGRGSTPPARNPAPKRRTPGAATLHDCKHCANVEGLRTPGKHKWKPEECWYNPKHRNYLARLPKWCTECNFGRGKRATHTAAGHDAYMKQRYENKVRSAEPRDGRQHSANAATALEPVGNLIYWSPPAQHDCHTAECSLANAGDTDTTAEEDSAGYSTDSAVEDERFAVHRASDAVYSAADELQYARTSLAAYSASIVAATAAAVAVSVASSATAVADGALAWTLRHTQWTAPPASAAASSVDPNPANAAAAALAGRETCGALRALVDSENKRTAAAVIFTDLSAAGTRKLRRAFEAIRAAMQSSLLADLSSDASISSDASQYTDCSAVNGAVDRFILESGLDGATPGPAARIQALVRGALVRSRAATKNLRVVAATTMNATLRDIACYRHYMSLARAFNALRFVAYDTWTENMVLAQRTAAVTIQSAIRGWITRLTLACDEITRVVRTRMAVRIQSAVRGALSRAPAARPAAPFDLRREIARQALVRQRRANRRATQLRATAQRRRQQDFRARRCNSPQRPHARGRSGSPQ